MATVNAGAPSNGSEWTWPTGVTVFDVGNSRGYGGSYTSVGGDTVWTTVSRVVSEQEFVEGRLFFKTDGRCVACRQEGKMFVPNPSNTYTWGGGLDPVRDRDFPADDCLCRACLKSWLVAKELMGDGSA